MKQISTLVLVCLLLHTTTFPQIANHYDIVIDELMADPTPQVGLPNNEWIELRNTSSITINLFGWKIGDATGLSGPMPNFNLRPDSFVIICTASAVGVLSVYGPTISVTSFPSLDNSGDIIYLRSLQNKIIHTVSYNDKWYHNELKKEGGWTLEMIDTQNPCSGITNWMAGIDNKGGTPGKKNSVDGINTDLTAPALLWAYATDSVTVTLVFDEALDSLTASVVTNYIISDGIGTPQNATAQTPVFDHINIKLRAPLQRNKVIQ